jgi:hypothetical protein
MKNVSPVEGKNFDVCHEQLNQLFLSVDATRYISNDDSELNKFEKNLRKELKVCFIYNGHLLLIPLTQQTANQNSKRIQAFRVIGLFEIISKKGTRLKTARSFFLVQILISTNPAAVRETDKILLARCR